MVAILGVDLDDAVWLRSKNFAVLLVAAVVLLGYRLWLGSFSEPAGGQRSWFEQLSNSSQGM